MLTPCVSRRTLSAPVPRQRKPRITISAEKSAPAPATKTAILPKGRNISRSIRPPVLLMEPPKKSPRPRCGGGASKLHLDWPKATNQSAPSAGDVAARAVPVKLLRGCDLQGLVYLVGRPLVGVRRDDLDDKVLGLGHVAL